MLLLCFFSLEWSSFFFPKSELVLFYFSPVQASHDAELAYGSVRAYMLLNVNNQNFSKTSISRQTSLVSEDYNLAVVVDVVFMKSMVVGCNDYTNKVTYVCRLAVNHQTCRHQYIVGCAAAKQLSVVCLQQSFS